MHLSVLYFLADVIVYPLMYYVVRYRRKVVRKNLEASFPNLTKMELKRMEKRFYHQFANEIAEIWYGRYMDDEEMMRRVRIVGTERLIELTKQYGGSMIMLAHIGCWEWMTALQLYVKEAGIRECDVYRQLKNKRVDKMMLALRQKRGGFCCEKGVLLRAMVRQRQQGVPTMYGMLSDQKPSPKNMHFWTTFLNQETSFLDGSETLARKFGYPVFYMHIRSPKKGYYDVEMELVAEDVAALKEYELTQNYADRLEKNIMEQPELWLWTHNRWKYTRGDS